MQANQPDFMVFTGNANPGMAAEIAKHLGTQLGAADVGRFSDGEVTVEIKQNVRARDVFVVQSTCAPTNDNLMELLIMVDALKRASAERISAVIPYFGYARQDRRPRSTRVPITAKVVANMLQAVGVARVLTMDLHADQIQGFFDIPVDNIYASPVLLGDLRQKNYEDLIVVSPDVGGVVRARDVFVVQSTCAPTNENLMELLIMVDALKRASAERISAVIPYFGYARQDRRPRSTRVPITAKVVANMLQAVGVARVLTMDLHADQIQGFFDIPVDNIYASPVLLGDLRQKNYEDLIVVSPDVGGVVRARALAKQLGCDLAIIDKRRPKANVSEVMHVIGEIEGRNCVIMDDMIDTAGTLVKAAEVLKERGAKSVYAYCTHPIFSGPAIERIAQGTALDEVVVTNTIPLNDNARGCTKIRQLSVAPLIAETIQRIAKGESVMSLFSDQDNLF